MALFRFFKAEKPTGFTYRPRFYEVEKNELERKLKEAREMRGGDPEMVKERIRRDLRRKGNYLTDRGYRQKRMLRSNVLILIIIAGLIVVTYAVLELYLPAIVKYFE